MAPRGDRTEQRSFGGAFLATAALRGASARQAVLDAFPAERSRARLMRLRPGGHILPHEDPMHTMSPAVVRVHVPVVTNLDVRFVVDGRRAMMGAGETWHVDVRFRHEVENAGDTPRVHLVMDLMRNAWLDALLERGDAVGTGSLRGYFHREIAASRDRAHSPSDLRR